MRSYTFLFIIFIEKNKFSYNYKLLPFRNIFFFLFCSSIIFVDLNPNDKDRSKYNKRK